MTSIPHNVIARYAEKNALDQQAADRVFTELELFLAQASRKRLSPSVEVDAAWHEFILHTQDYMEYCVEHFGRYIHHRPTSCLQSNGIASNDSNCASCSAGCTSSPETHNEQ